MKSLKIKLNTLLDILFFILWVTTMYFTRNLFCQLMMVVFFAGVGYMCLRRSLLIVKTKFFLWNMLFILWGFVQIPAGIAIDSSAALTMVRSLALNLLMIFAIVQYILRKKSIHSFLKLVENGIFAVVFVVVVLSLGTLLSGRLGRGTEINSNVLAMLCVYGISLNLFFSSTSEKKWPYFTRNALYLLFVLLSGSRKGFLMIVLAILLLNMIHGKRQTVNKILFIIAASGILYLLVMNVDFLYNVIGVRIENLIVLLTQGTTSEGSLTSRLKLTDIGMSYIRENPWTGYGYDCFKVISGFGGQGKTSYGSYGYYSHNNYIELLFSGGIIGFVLYYIPMVLLAWDLFKNRKTDPCLPYLFTIFVTRLAVEYAYVSYYSRVDAYLTAIVLGCLLFCKRNLPEQTADPISTKQRSETDDHAVHQQTDP